LVGEGGVGATNSGEPAALLAGQVAGLDRRLT
jgi:hypothetical protein